MSFGDSPKVGNRFFENNSGFAGRPRREKVKRAAGAAIEILEERIVLAVISSLVDPFTGSAIDTAKWNVTTRGLENNAPAGYDAPSEDANGLRLGGTSNTQYWYGDSLESVNDFSSQAPTTVTVDRTSLTGSGSAYRSSLWILQPNGAFVHFSQNVGETGWSYNANYIGSNIVTGSGTAITLFNNTAGSQGDHIMKLAYTPGAGTIADVGIYLDGVLGATVHFTNWDNTVPFKVILTGQARATNDTVAAIFQNLDAEAAPVPTIPPAAPTNLTATAAAHGLNVALSWLDNANNEINYRVERSTDGVKFTEIATVPAVNGTGTTVNYAEVAPAANTKFYYRVRAFNTATNGLSAYTAIQNITTAPAIFSLVDPLNSAAGIDTTKWDITNRGLENNGPAGYNAPSEDPSGLILGGTTSQQYWYGSSLESKDVFYSQATTTISVDRLFLTGSGSAYRSSLWIYQPTVGGQYLHFSQNIGETGWSFNQTGTGGGTAIAAFNANPDAGDHIMKLVYTPLGGSNATVDMYLDGVLGATATYTNWNNTVPFKVILTGQARAANDMVSTEFTNFSAVGALAAAPPLAPTKLLAQKSGTAVALSWLDNADNELSFSVERSTDGVNFTSIATIPASQNTGGTVLYTDGTAVQGTYFYRVRAFNYAALGSFSAASNLAAMSFPAASTAAVTDPFTADTVNTNLWTVTNRGLENTGPAGQFDPSASAGGVTLGAFNTQQYWFGSSLESNNTFSSGIATTVQVERVSLAGSGSAYRSSLWLLQPGGQFLHFAQDVLETNWEYNQTAGNIGTKIASFDAFANDVGDHIMKLVYKPLGGTNATVDIYLDGNLGATATFNNWDNSVPFRVILTGQARAINDTVSATFANLSITPTPPAPTIISGTANADTFYIKKDADGINDDVWINSATPGVGAPTQKVLFSQAGGLEFDGLGANDLLTVDYTAGSPVPVTGLKFAGGGGTDTLKLIGANATDAFGLGSGGVNHAGGGTLQTNTDVEKLAIAAGIYTFDVQAITSGSVSALDVGSGATARVIYPDAPANDPNTAAIVAAIHGFLASGYAGGAWNGPGINSADAGSHPGTGLGYSVANDTFTIKYTLAGDIDLDGTVGFADLVALGQNYGATDAGVNWLRGDVTYDGQVGFADLVALGQTYGRTLAAAPVAAAVEDLAEAQSASPVTAVAPKVVSPVVPSAVAPVVTPKPVPVTAPKVTATKPVTSKPVAKPVVAAKPTPFAARTSLQTTAKINAANANVLGKKPATTTLFR